MINQQKVKATKMWIDVMKGQPVTFTSDEEVRIISKHSAAMSVLESNTEELAALVVSGKDIDMFFTMETMKLVMAQLIEAIEDYEA
jgi:flagella basal body P-ring formation protein FlgA